MTPRLEHGAGRSDSGPGQAIGPRWPHTPHARPPHQGPHFAPVASKAPVVAHAHRLDSAGPGCLVFGPYSLSWPPPHHPLVLGQPFPVQSPDGGPGPVDTGEPACLPGIQDRTLAFSKLLPQTPALQWERCSRTPTGGTGHETPHPWLPGAGSADVIMGDASSFARP